MMVWDLAERDTRVNSEVRLFLNLREGTLIDFRLLRLEHNSTIELPA